MTYNHENAISLFEDFRGDWLKFKQDFDFNYAVSAMNKFNELIEYCYFPLSENIYPKGDVFRLVGEAFLLKGEKYNAILNLLKAIQFDNLRAASLLLENLPPNEVEYFKNNLDSFAKDFRFHHELLFYSSMLKEGHFEIIKFFSQENPFGAHPPLMTYFSTLKPEDRCAILEVLYGLRRYFNLDIIMDKLMLAYCKDECKDGVDSVIEIYQSKGTRQDVFDHLVYLKSNFGKAPFRSDEERMLLFTNYEENTSNPIDLEFLSVLKSFVKN